MSTPRRALLWGGAAVLATSGVAVLVRTFLGLTDWSVLVAVGLLELVLVVAGYGLLLQRRSAAVARRSLELLRTHERRESRDRHAVQTLTERVEALGADLLAVSGRVESLATTTSQDRAEAVLAVEALAGEVRDRTSVLDSRLAQTDDAEARLRHSRADFAQMEALLELRQLVDCERPMPTLRGWAAAPTSLLAAVRPILDREASLVVECGSGASSVWIGHVLRRLGRGRYVALEHDEHYAALTRAEVARHGLDDVVEVRHAPLRRMDVAGEPFDWYEMGAVADLADIDVIFVDGPPGDTGPAARYPALPLLAPHCRPGAVLVLDDAARPEEREVVDRWVRMGAEVIETSFWEKGFTVLALPSR